MPKKPTSPTHALDLTRRERQVMDVVYRRGAATAAEVLAELEDPPGYSGVRTILRVLVDKELLRATDEGGRLVYRAAHRPSTVRSAALSNVVKTFFAGSAEQAMLALLESRHSKLDKNTAQELRRLIRDASTAEGENES